MLPDLTGVPHVQRTAETFARRQVAQEVLLERLRSRFATVRQINDGLSRSLFDIGFKSGIDFLTGIPNRLGLMGDADSPGQLYMMLDEAERKGLGLAVMMFDVDNFKHFNDTYGHKGGDTALVAVARGIRGVIRDADYLSRFGGDEFVGLFYGENPDNMLNLAREIGEAVAGTGITLSIGLAHSLGLPVPSMHTSQVARMNAELLLTQADAAAFFSKKAGKNTATLWTPDVGLKPELELNSPE